MKPMETANRIYDAWYTAALRTAAVAAVFCLIVLALLVANYLRANTMNPLQPQRIDALQVELAKRPKDDIIKQQIRYIDYEIRREYFRSQAFSIRGAYLLFGGIAVYLLMWEFARRRRPLLPTPRPDAGGVALAAATMGRHAVFALAVILAGLLVTVAALSRHDTTAEYAKAVSNLPAEGSASTPPVHMPAKAPTPAGSVAANPASKPVAPSAAFTVTKDAGSAIRATASGTAIVSLPPFPEDWQAQWPQFRGPQGTGIATVTGAPTDWDGTTGKHIRWKTAIALPGKNSPVVWGDRVFLTGATEKLREMYCVDAGSGKVLWKAAVTTPESARAKPPSVMDDTGYAAPTMAVDRERAYAIFANGDIAAFDHAGKQVWARNLGTPESAYGYAASLAIAPTRLFIQYDQGSEAEEGKSALLALDTATGKTVWRVKRPVPNSWSSPILAHTSKGDQVITSANPWVIAYDPGSGSELWRAKCLDGDIAPTPTVAGGLVFAVNAYANLAAIRPDGRGDVTATHIAWMAADGLPDIVSPLSNGEIVLLADSGGMVTCYEASSGKKLWEHAFETPFHASPVLVGNRIYMIDHRGVTHLLEAGRAFKEIAVMPLGEEVEATPAFVGNRIFVRGKHHLFCIGEK